MPLLGGFPLAHGHEPRSDGNRLANGRDSEDEKNDPDALCAEVLTRALGKVLWRLVDGAFPVQAFEECRV
jgi:hypothetical protein